MVSDCRYSRWLTVYGNRSKHYTEAGTAKRAKKTGILGFDNSLFRVTIVPIRTISALIH